MIMRVKSEMITRVQGVRVSEGDNKSEESE